MIILGIETSCDETAVCVMDATAHETETQFKILGNALNSQAALHAPHGGVFPNLAKREHEANLVPLLEKALSGAALLHQGVTSTSGLPEILTREQELHRQLSEFLSTHARPAIDAIAVTFGPGLEPALWIGVNFAKALAHAWNVPLIPVNHMEGHIIISMIQPLATPLKDQACYAVPTPHYPLLSLLISGGHTELVLSRAPQQYEIIGQTRDDAVGEAFDKVARMMDLPYPGGPEISRLANTARTELAAPPRDVVRLPRPMIDTDNYDFSFSGLKTAVRRIVETHQPLTDEHIMSIALEFENACTEVLIAKTMRAVEEYGVRTVVVGGGVSANTHIRAELASAIQNFDTDTKLLIPEFSHATDNALMIALAGFLRAQRNEYAAAHTITARGNASLTEISSR